METEHQSFHYVMLLEPLLPPYNADHRTQHGFRAHRKQTTKPGPTDLNALIILAMHLKNFKLHFITHIITHICTCVLIDYSLKNLSY